MKENKQERIQTLELDLIVSDDELKVRVEIDQQTVHDYYEAMATEEDVKKFPLITVYFDGCRYWLADGHHRYWAAFRRGYKTMTVRVIDGSHDDALLAAVKLNAKNGLRFHDDDWEKIIPLISSKEQWKDWTNRRLAEELQCGRSTVDRYRPTISVGPAGATEKRVGKDGKSYPARKAAAKKQTSPLKENESGKTGNSTAPVPPVSVQQADKINSCKPQIPEQPTERQLQLRNLYPDPESDELTEDIIAAFPKDSGLLCTLPYVLCENVLKKRRLKYEAENVLVEFIRKNFFRADDEMKSRILRTILREIIDDHESVDKVFELIDQEKKRLDLLYA